MRLKPRRQKNSVKGHGGLAPVFGHPQNGLMPTNTLKSRQHRAQLRTAVLRAHPDHGGSREDLERALAALRAASSSSEAGLSALVPAQPTAPARPAYREPARPPKESVRGSLWGIGKTIFLVYFVAMPIMIGFGLVLGRIQEWLF